MSSFIDHGIIGLMISDAAREARDPEWYGSFQDLNAELMISWNELYLKSKTRVQFHS